MTKGTKRSLLFITGNTVIVVVITIIAITCILFTWWWYAGNLDDLEQQMLQDDHTGAVTYVQHPAAKPVPPPL